jgi:hypothetical protein
VDIWESGGRVETPLFLTSTLVGNEWSASHSSRFIASVPTIPSVFQGMLHADRWADEQRDIFTLSNLRLPQLGGPGFLIYFTWEQGSPVKTQIVD